jgi:hypothetical protein
MYKSIPTYIDGVWTTTDFNSKEEFIEYTLSILKNRVSISLMSYHINLIRKLSYLMRMDIIAINLLDRKILPSIGKIKKINAEWGLSIKKVKRVGI